MIFIIAYFSEKTPGRKPFVFLMGMAMIWTFGYAMELSVSSNQDKLFWLNIQQIGIYLSPFAWLFLSIEHLKSRISLKKKFFMPLLVIPFSHIFLNFTNDYHNLLRKEIIFENVNSIIRVKTETSIIFSIFIGFYYLLLLISLINFLRAIKKRKGFYRIQSFILLVSLIIPYIFNIIDFFNINPFYPYSPTALTFIPSGVLIMYALFKHNLFKITPIAHEKIIKNMDVGVVVTNNKFEIIDYNPFMTNEFKYKENFIGKKLENKDPTLFKKLIEFTEEDEEQNLEFQKYKDLSKHYRLKISSLNEDKGYIIIVYDITSQKILEEELFFKATKDFLTKTSNRYEYFGQSEKEFEISKKDEKNLSVIMIDIDDFKEINDKYGHSAGDYVLESFSILVKSLLPQNSIFGRLGGEEFSIVLTNYDIEESKLIAEKVRTKIENNPVNFMGEKINYTISLGISSINENMKTFDQLLKSSDDALYRAKNMGKNCISV